MTECADLCPSLVIRPDDIFEWYDGPIIAAVRCPKCDSCAILELVDREPRHPIRIFAMRPVSRDAVDLYLRNKERGSCDPSRYESELHALLCAAGAPAHLVAYDVDAGAPVASRPFPAGEALSSAPWQKRIPAPDDLRWFTLVGVPKRS